jgi:ubiquinone/menaquinone biosynthesis C-methylase UbiE
MTRAGPWAAWWERWDRFQETYVPGRELQFRLITDYLALLRRDEPLQVLDLCSGPGSFGSRILRERPRAQVVAVDYDPWLLELGRRAAPHGDAIAWVDADLRAAWTRALPGAAFDAVVATTAMQWFEEDEVVRIYRDVASLLAPGGAFLTSDLVPRGSAAARSLAEAATVRWRARAIESPAGDHWADFWADARAEPAFSELLEERARRLVGRHPLPSRPFAFHETALRASGFAEVSEIWRHSESAIILAQRRASVGS